jgi:hypothetical protein
LEGRIKMALQILKELPDGSESTYFNISRIDIYPLEQIADISVSGYISKQKRNQGKTPNFSYSIRVSASSLKNGCSLNELYAILKANEFFVGSEDV